MAIPSHKGYACYMTGCDSSGIHFVIPTADGMQRSTLRITPNGEAPANLAEAFAELAEWCREFGADENELREAIAERGGSEEGGEVN